jgi:hypothetical protein
MTQVSFFIHSKFHLKSPGFPPIATQKNICAKFSKPFYSAFSHDIIGHEIEER